MTFIGQPIKEHQYLFIDGAYLREVLKGISAKYFVDSISIDFKKLVGGFRKTFFYDCLPENEDSNTESQKIANEKHLAFLNELRMIPGVHVFEGQVRGKNSKKRQKMVDTMMAVDMLSHSYRKNVSDMTLLAGDLDFKPIVDALILDGTYVRLWYEKTTTSTELLKSVDARKPINIQTLLEWADEDFLKANPKPESCVTGESGYLSGYASVEKGVTTDGREIELLKNETLYFISRC